MQYEGSNSLKKSYYLHLLRLIRNYIQLVNNWKRKMLI